MIQLTAEFARLTPEDWELVLPMLQENQRLFGIALDQLLTVNGRRLKPAQVYRKVVPGIAKAMEPEETDEVAAEAAETAAAEN